MTIMLMLTSSIVLLDQASMALGRLTVSAPRLAPSTHTHNMGSFRKRQGHVLH